MLFLRVSSWAVVFSTSSGGDFSCLVLAVDLKKKIKSKLLSTGEAARSVFSERFLVYSHRTMSFLCLSCFSLVVPKSPFILNSFFLSR